MREQDPFYVGYLARAPRPHARTTQVTAGLLAAICVAVAAGAMALQSSPGSGQWLDASPRTWTGVLTTSPYPLLRVERDGRTQTAVVVGFGKRGADDRVRSFDGQRVEISGTLIERDGRMLIELLERDDAIQGRGAGEALAPPQELGTVTIRGEVIDPKCYLGAMKPGSGKTHRACAIRCVSGGIPPMLVNHGPGGPEYYLLASSTGGPVNEAILPYVADAVTARGRAHRVGDLVVLSIEDGGITRVNGP